MDCALVLEITVREVYGVDRVFMGVSFDVVGEETVELGDEVVDAVDFCGTVDEVVGFIEEEGEIGGVAEVVEFVFIEGM